MSTYLKLAWRNIWRKRRRTIITISAIVFAVIAAILMQSMNRGSYEMIIDRTVTFSTGYIQIQDYRYQDESSLDNAFYYTDELRQHIHSADNRIAHLVPRIETFMLAANGGQTRGSIVTGIDFETEHRYNGLGDYLTEGRFFEPDEQAVVIAREMADRLQLATGDTLVLIGQGRFGMSASGLFNITGILEHPVRELNNMAVYMPLQAADRKSVV